MEDGTGAVQVNPELQREVTIEEDRIDRLYLLTERQQSQRYLMVNRTTVQLGGDDDVLVTHIARHDIFVELDS